MGAYKISNSGWIQFFFTVAVIAVSLNYLYSNKKFDEKIETLIICVLKGAVISAVILVFLQNIRVTEAGDKYLICPLILFWSPIFAPLL